MVLGDSIAAGGELQLEKGELAFPALLKSRIENHYTKLPIELFVFAGGGYGTREEVAGYEKYSAAFDPDMVILSYCHNDTVELYPRIIRKDGEILLGFYKSIIPYFNKIAFNRFLAGKFLIFKLMNESLMDFFARHNLSVYAEYDFIGIEKLYKSFRKLYLLTKDKDIAVIVVEFPFLQENFWNESTWERDAVSNLIKECCSEFNFSYIDILEVYKDYSPEKLKVSPYDSVHPNALGHKIAAERIVNFIIERDVLAK